MLVCASCGADWDIHGKQYKRLFSDKVDYKCMSCKSKKKPDALEALRWEWEQPAENKKNVLVIPDLHLPFVKNGYLEFLKSTYDKWDCNTVVSIGDMIDFHAMSRHASDPDGMSASDELESAIVYAKEIANVFPVMKVCYGNHDRIPSRQAFDQGISASWIKTIKDVLIEHGVKCHGWDFSTEHIIDNVMYVHGENRKAKARMLQDGISIVQGHYHTEANIHHHANNYQRNFSMQLGSLISDHSYAAAYAKHFPKSIKCCGLVLDGTPIIEMWKL